MLRCDFERYTAAIAVPLGDRRAREELDRPEPNYALARQGFLDGGNNPDDIDGMISLFRRFRHVNYIERAIGIWTKADHEIERLNESAMRLHALVQTGARDPAAVQAALDEINAINARLTPLEDAFSATLGEASRKTQLLLGAVTPLRRDTADPARHLPVAPAAGTQHRSGERPARQRRALQPGGERQQRRPVGLECAHGQLLFFSALPRVGRLLRAGDGKHVRRASSRCCIRTIATRRTRRQPPTCATTLLSTSNSGAAASPASIAGSGRAAGRCATPLAGPCAWRVRSPTSPTASRPKRRSTPRRSARKSRWLPLPTR